MDNAAPGGSVTRQRTVDALRLMRGVTMIELMVVITILAILLGLAVPYMQEFFVRNRLAAAANDFLAALADARNEAMRRGVPVTLRSTAGSKNWTNGWTLCVDANAAAPTGTCAAGATNTLRRGMALNAPMTINSNATFAAAVTFDSGGRVVSTTANGLAVTYPGLFVICHGTTTSAGAGRSRSRAILVNAPGRIRQALDADGNGQPENDSGANITTCSP